MRILQVNTFDAVGGAARVARTLFETYRARGHESWLAVAERGLDDPNVVAVPNEDAGGRLLRSIGKAVDFQLGVEDFRFPGTARLLELTGSRPDVVHGHNLHGGYFDLRALPWLSRETRVVLTLHDAWLLSGHCAHSLDCERWRTGCGHCPYLGIDPPVRRDATAWNWRRKRSIYRRSRFGVATPSRWLMDRVEASILTEGTVDTRVIPNGVDLGVFRPGDRVAARHSLNLPQDAAILLFAATAVRRNPWKDLALVRAAVTAVADGLDRPVVLVALGDDGSPERAGRAEVRYVPYQSDPWVVARYHQAADVYVHAARAETFPTSVVEALACGTPVVATAVGGVVEQVEEGRTGFAVPPADRASLAAAVRRILDDPSLRAAMSRDAATAARERFDLERQADAYLGWYAELGTRHGARQAAGTSA